MASPFIASNPPRRVLVLAPSQALREQLASDFAAQRVLRSLGGLPGLQVFDRSPSVHELRGRVSDWDELKVFDVVVALPNSISPHHYDQGVGPPRDLFDFVVIDEAHHSPAPTWKAVLDHFNSAHALLLTATPIRRDGKRIPGELVYHYPLRRALDEGLYQPVQPHLLDCTDPADKPACDRLIADRATSLLNTPEHHNSVLLVRGGSIQRLTDLVALYRQLGVQIASLHNGLSDTSQRDVLDRLQRGQLRAVAVVGMLGEGYDLPSLRIAAYHDKHKSLPSTIQLIGRLARVHPDHPQPSALVTVRDIDVFPELKGVVRILYEQEDTNWAEVLPGVIDDEIERERQDRLYVGGFTPSRGELAPNQIHPLQRAIVYEVGDITWRPQYHSGVVPERLVEGQAFCGGQIVYSGVDPMRRLLVLGVRHVAQPRWYSDPGVSQVTFELHIVGFREAPRADLPSLVFLNVDSKAAHSALLDIIGLHDVAQLASPERIGQYMDGLERRSVSAVGMRSTNAAIRGTAAYRNFMGASVDRGLRSADTTRTALGHVNVQLTDDGGSTNAGAALEKSKVWITRYRPLRSFDHWIEKTAGLIWFQRSSKAGPLLPGVNRGTRLIAWPDAPPLAAEMNPALVGRGYQVTDEDGVAFALEDLELYVSDDPLGLLSTQPEQGDVRLPLLAVHNDRVNNEIRKIWLGTVELDGSFNSTNSVIVQRGYSGHTALTELLAEFPPTIYFLDGTTVIGRLIYDSRNRGSILDLSRVVEHTWPDVDITAETRRLAEARGHGQKSVHDGLAAWLVTQPRRGTHRWIVFNDGSGEIADFIVIDLLGSGEVVLGLWHAKGSESSVPALRVKDVQVVVSQAIRSRRWIPSLQLWSELGSRLNGTSKPSATVVDGSDDATELYQWLGLENPPTEEFRTWVERPPVVVGHVGVVQPGLSKKKLMSEGSGEDAAGIIQLLTVLSDTTMSDGAGLTVLSSI